MDRVLLVMVHDGLTGPLHEPYGAAYHRLVERHGLRTPPARAGTFRGLFLVITVADGSDREMLVMVRDGLTRPLHEPYGALTIDTMTA
ncbi:MAG: hypothetical protein RL240_87 [Planctomycetota bacterium]